MVEKTRPLQRRLKDAAIVAAIWCGIGSVIAALGLGVAGEIARSITWIKWAFS